MALTAADALLKATAQGAFWQSFETFPSIMDGLIQPVTSNSDQETYPWLAYAPAVREMIGSRVKRSVPELQWVIRNKKWENTVAINYETRKFAKLNQVQALLSNLGSKARAYPDKLTSGLIAAGNTTACYDTQFFYDTDHSDPGAAYVAPQSNLRTFTALSGTTFTDVELANAIVFAKGVLMSFLDGDGDPVMMDQSKPITVQCAVDMYPRLAAIAVLSSLTGGAGNPALGQFKPVANPWLAPVLTADLFYAFNSESAHKAFILQTADPVTLEDDLGGDNDFNTKDVSFGSFGYYNVGYGDWRCSVRVAAS